eukprot:TRINITY_DN2072_c0_g1_i2.p1 TRINITY_DN2072_c0_g1~~TRINITY_DN2072_c0_g1_i2.p1  ORF type:complete len:1323 (-),score=278.87 TRINITY_DN2072_c0_g1_i2:94-3852(-)
MLVAVLSAAPLHAEEAEAEAEVAVGGVAASCHGPGAVGSPVPWWLLFRSPESGGWLYTDDVLQRSVVKSKTAQARSRGGPLFNTVASLWGGPAPDGSGGSSALPLNAGYTAYMQLEASGNGFGPNGGLVGYTRGGSGGGGGGDSDGDGGGGESADTSQAAGEEEADAGGQLDHRGFLITHNTLHFPPLRWSAAALGGSSVRASAGDARVDAAVPIENPLHPSDLQGEWGWLGSAMDASDYFLCISLESDADIEHALEQASLMNAAVTASSLLEGPPLEPSIARPWFPLPDREALQERCLKSHDTCTARALYRPSNVLFSSLAVSPFQLLDTCIYQDQVDPDYPHNSSLVLESSLDTKNSSLAEPFPVSSVALVTRENIDLEAQQNMHLLPLNERFKPFFPVCFGKYAPYALGVHGHFGSHTICFHHEEVWNWFWRTGRVYEESCETPYTLLLESPSALALESELQLWQDASGSASAFDSQFQSRRGQVFLTRPVEALPVVMNVERSSPFRTLSSREGDFDRITLTMHDGGFGELFSLRVPESRGSRTTFIDAGHHEASLARAVRSLAKRGASDAADYHGVVIMSALPRHSIAAAMHETQPTTNTRGSPSAALDHLMELRREVDTPLSLYINPLWVAALDALEAYARGKAYTRESIVPRGASSNVRTELVAVLESSYGVDCSGASGVAGGAEWYGGAQALVANMTSVGGAKAMLRGFSFEGDTLNEVVSSPHSRGWNLEVLAPSKEEVICHRIPSVLLGPFGVYGDFVAFLRSRGFTGFWSEIASDMPAVFSDFRQVQMSNSAFSAQKSRQPNQGKNAKIQASASMSTLLALTRDNPGGSGSTIVGLFTNGVIPKETASSKQLSTKGQKSPTDILFMTVSAISAHSAELYEKFRASYYLFTLGQSSRVNHGFEALKTILDLRRPLSPSKSNPCGNAAGTAKEFSVMFMHDKLLVDDSGAVAKKSKQSGRGSNILHSLMWSCTIENMDEWLHDAELFQVCRYSPACRKYSLGFVAQENSNAGSIPWMSLDIQKDDYGSTSMRPQFARSSGFVIDCNKAISYADGGYAGCITTNLYNDGLHVKRGSAPTTALTRRDRAVCEAQATLGIDGCVQDLATRCRTALTRQRPREGGLGDEESFKELQSACKTMKSYCRVARPQLSCPKVTEKRATRARQSLAKGGGAQSTFECTTVRSAMSALGVQSCIPNLRSTCQRRASQLAIAGEGDSVRAALQTACNTLFSFCEGGREYLNCRFD